MQSSPSLCFSNCEQSTRQRSTTHTFAHAVECAHTRCIFSRIAVIMSASNTVYIERMNRLARAARAALTVTASTPLCFLPSGTTFADLTDVHLVFCDSMLLARFLLRERRWRNTVFFSIRIRAGERWRERIRGRNRRRRDRLQRASTSLCDILNKMCLVLQASTQDSVPAYDGSSSGIVRCFRLFPTR